MIVKVISQYLLAIKIYSNCISNSLNRVRCEDTDGVFPKNDEDLTGNISFTENS